MNARPRRPDPARHLSSGSDTVTKGATTFVSKIDIGLVEALDRLKAAHAEIARAKCFAITARKLSDKAQFRAEQRTVDGEILATIASRRRANPYRHCEDARAA